MAIVLSAPPWKKAWSIRAGWEEGEVTVERWRSAAVFLGGLQIDPYWLHGYA